MRKAIAVLSLVLCGTFFFVGCDSEESQNPEAEVGSETPGDESPSLTEPDTSEESDAETGEENENAGDATSEAEDVEETVEEPFETTGLTYGEFVGIEPGGDTSCSRGTPYRFFVRGGKVNKVLIDFAGGGACWNELTCSVAGAIFSEDAPSEASLKAAIDQNLLSGIYDQNNPDNPFKDWFLIHIPYCTGDIHWGNATQVYSDTVTIEHKGYPNTQSALDYVKEHFDAPDELFVTGCSAGSYGAILHSSSIAETYPDAKLTVLGDSGAGIITDDWFADSFPNWNAEAALPEWFVTPGGSIADLTIVDVYSEIANHHPNVRFSQYSTAFDSNQEFYFTAMGGDVELWSGRLFETLNAIVEKTENFTYYITPGEVHCILPYTIFYQEPATGGSVVDWINELMTAETMPAPKACVDEECTTDLWCQECAESESPGWHCGHCQSN